MRILIVGGNFSNKGAEAMLWTVVAELSARISGASFYVGNQHVRFRDEDIARERGLSVLEPHPHSRFRTLKLLAEEAMRRPSLVRQAVSIRGALMHHAELCDQVDAVIDISGYIFGDKAPASLKSALKTLKLCDMMRDRGKPFVFMPQMWGPFRERSLAVPCRYSLERASLIFARDEISRQHLAQLLHREMDDVALAPDIAFLFGAKNGRREVRDGPLYESAAPLLGVAPNMRVYERCAGRNGANEYVQVLVALINHFTKQGNRVLLIPHEYDGRGVSANTKDDRHLCRLIERHVERANECVATVESESAAGLKWAIGRCDLLLASRFHALVAALSQGIPAVAIGWAHKYPELLKLFGQEDLLLDYTQLDSDLLVSLVEGAWKDRERRSDQVKKHLQQVHRSASRCIDEVARALTTTAAAIP